MIATANVLCLASFPRFRSHFDPEVDATYAQFLGAAIEMTKILNRSLPSISNLLRAR